MNKQVVLALLAMICVVSLASASSILSYQGRIGQNGQSLSSGNITLLIYNESVGGSLVWNSSDEFLDSISNGYFDLTLGTNPANPLNLEYGKRYWVDMEVNGENIDWSGNDRVEFESGVGDISQIQSNQTVYIYTNVTINATTNITQIITNNITITEILNSTNIIVENITINNNLNATGNLTIGDRLTFRLGAIIENTVSGIMSIISNTTIYGDLNTTGTINVNGNITHNDASDFYIKSSGQNTIVSVNDVEMLKMNSSDSTVTVGSGTPSMTIDTNGNVGIGTESPTQKLDVNGSTVISSNLTVASNALFVNSAFGNEKVGIGTNNPYTNLQIFKTSDAYLALTSDISAISGLYLTEGGIEQNYDKYGFGLIFNGSDNKFTIKSGADSGIVNDRVVIERDTGNVGIGASPTQKLHVEGNLNVTGIIYGNGSGITGLITSDLTCTDCIGETEITDSYLLNTGDTASGNYTFDTTTLHIDSTNDRVGIGTANPGSSLHVLKDSSTPTIVTIENGQNQDESSAGLTLNNIYNWTIYTKQSSGDKLLVKSGTSGKDILTLDTSGNVGIGTASPTSLLTLNGSSSSSTSGPHIMVYTSQDSYPVYQQLDWTHDNIGLSFDTYYNGSWRSSDDNSSFQIYKLNDALRLRYGNATAGSAITFNEGIVLNKSGDVGIGTATPSQKLHVQGNLNVTGTIYGTGTGLTGTASSLIAGNATNLACTDCVDGTDLTDTLALDANLAITSYNVTFDTSTLHIDSTNNRVGIGTTTPSSTLTVNGIINVSNNKIINLATPTASSDAATKGYVDAALDNVTLKVYKSDGTTLLGEFLAVQISGFTVTDGNSSPRNLEGCDMLMYSNSSNNLAVMDAGDCELNQDFWYYVSNDCTPTGSSDPCTKSTYTPGFSTNYGEVMHYQGYASGGYSYASRRNPNTGQCTVISESGQNCYRSGSTPNAQTRICGTGECQIK